MSLYHEAAGILSGPSSHGGSLKSRVFGNKDKDKDKELKSPPAAVYALALESSKWSPVLKEVIESAQLLQKERKLTPVLAVLLVHDFLVAKGGIALPQTHGLRAAVERHKARLTSEFTRARLRRKCSSVDALRHLVEADARTGPVHPRWIRVNTLKTTVDDQLETTFVGWDVVPTVQDVIRAATESPPKRVLCLDGHIPNLIAVPPGPVFDFAKADAYKTGALILQDKASCFPAYLLDPRPEEGDIIDACAAPGNKTTHLAAILAERGAFGSESAPAGASAPRQNKKKQKQRQKIQGQSEQSTIFAFEKDKHRAQTLDSMVKLAGSDGVTIVHPGHDFLKADPAAAQFRNVRALLLDPSCSGSGIVGRDDAPELYLPADASAPNPTTPTGTKEKYNKKRKRPQASTPNDENSSKPLPQLVGDDGETFTVLSSDAELRARIAALAAFQLSLLQHAFSFPAARRVTYSTCSIHAGENEHVVLAALASPAARTDGWRLLARADQPRGMRDWPVRGDAAACAGDEAVADACVRANRDDGRGVMGFFVAAFVRDALGLDGEKKEGEGEDGPFVRDDDGRIVRDQHGIPTLKATGDKAVTVDEFYGVEDDDEDDDSSDSDSDDSDSGSDEDEGEEDSDGPFARDAHGRVIRDGAGLPTLKSTGRTVQLGGGGGADEWGGFED
ncbi:S-adenosyl-L-methionine-dependent methyltransferase [Lasiosphaeria miniovina]|uniref:S-adenosyl-L-methionine-dependent methyltransferase n=1 Tax=Lasiosphaeria miniovina TaxID=1954250 RepID=A0AA40E3L8_9PEZI|nr:S-adenosyl-L-methionine-dependent methyltransferase [Lasiosphaeria miniovina]KAK0722841.1 S-adenosyl-L-methionine-dependent methyltransferase [Lasiosphaeria miniovina]